VDRDTCAGERIIVSYLAREDKGAGGNLVRDGTEKGRKVAHNDMKTDGKVAGAREERNI
jgi:hypothetical protein